MSLIQRCRRSRASCLARDKIALSTFCTLRQSRTALMIASCASSLDHSSACAVEAEQADELGIAVPAETIEWRPFPSPRRIRYTSKRCIGVIGLFKGQLSQFAPYQADLVATGTPEQKDLFLPRGASLAFFKRAGLSLGGFRRSGRELLDLLERPDADRAVVIGPAVRTGRCPMARRTPDRPRGRRGRDCAARSRGRPPSAPQSGRPR
jgi:hypothetical protein